MKLGGIGHFQSGGTPQKDRAEFFGGNIPWVSTVALNGGRIGEKDANTFITEQAIQHSAAKIVPVNSLLVGTRVGIGKAAVNDVPMATSQDIVSITDIDLTHWDLQYLILFVCSQAEYLNQQARGATIKGIKADTLKALPVKEISLSAQKQIVDKLTRTKKLIDNRQHVLALLDELVKARFVEMFGDIARREPLRDLCNIITDGTHQPPQFTAQGIPFLFVSNIVNNAITYDAEKFISLETYNELIKRTPIEVGDILLSTVGSYGHPAVVTSKRKFLFQRHIAYIKPKHELLNAYYLHAALLSDKVQHDIDMRVKGIAQKTLNLTEIKKLTIPVPSLSLQNQFAAFVHQVDASKAAVQAQLAGLTTLRAKLMQDFFG